MRLPSPGERVGPYLCERLLASGGMGAVFVARQLSLGRAVALKVLLAPDDPELVARFEREAEACARLDHPNLVGVHDAGVSEGTCYLALELVDGESLQDQLSRGGPFEESRALAAISEAVKGITHAHGVGVLHRDLKPANLLWDRASGVVRIVDFGLTGRLRQSDSLTVTGEILGTPGYLAPEQATGETQRADVRTDVYGLGATLFALLSGRPPFISHGLLGLAEVAQDSPPSLRDLCPEVSPAVAAAVAKSLAKDPADRWPSAEAFGEALAGRSSAQPPVKGRLLLGLLALLLLALGLALPYQLSRSQSSVQSSPSALEDYTAWRAKGFGAFLWEGREEGARLEEWRASLEGLKASPERDRALGEVQALTRLSRARLRGRAAPPRAEAPVPSGALVQAVVEAEGLRREAAERALELVPERQRSTRDFSRCSQVVDSLADAKAYERAIRRRGPTRAWALRVFPRVLTFFAKRESASTLLRVFRTGKSAGAQDPEQALKAALNASAEARLEELGRSRRDKARYVRSLCDPLRGAGLWPKGAFADALRADFLEEVRTDPQTDASALKLLLYEHELFYRVDPTRSSNRKFAVGVLLRLGGMKLDDPSNRVFERTRMRYGGAARDRQQEQGTIPGWVEIVARLPEPGSGLDAAARWWREAIRGQRDLPSTQRALVEVLSIEPNDLDPAVSINMLREAGRLWYTVTPSQGPEWRALAEQAQRIGLLEFERALAWQVQFPVHSLTGSMVSALRFAAVGHLRTGRLELALACYEKALGRVRREIEGVEGEAGEGTLRSGLVKSLLSIYSRLATATSVAGLEAERLEVLVGALPHLEQAPLHIRDAIWSALLIGYVDAGELEQAQELARSLGNGEGYSYRLLLGLVRVHLASDRFSEAQGILGQATEILKRAEALQGPTEPPERVVELRIALRRLAKLRLRVDEGLASQGPR